MNALHILVVDDEPGITKLCQRLLTRAGFSVSTYTDPQKALRYLEQAHVDLLLVDIRMPEIDGFEVVSVAKRHQPDIATLVMTGFGTVETAIRALRQGVDGLILKPFETGKELVLTAQQALEDNQRKRDAAHMQALRPLFDVTEGFLAETSPEKLAEVIVSAVGNHLHCPHTGYYQYDDLKQGWRRLASSGNKFPDIEKRQIREMIAEASETGIPALLDIHPDLWTYERNLGLGSAVYLPVQRSRVRGLIYAGRNQEAQPFREIDLDMLQILGRQAAVALENAHLYTELRAYIQRIEESQQALLRAEKMAAAGRLTASIAHEINNPLQAVQNCLHLAGRDDLGADKQDEYLGLAQTELERLMNTVQRMLDFYRPGAAASQSVDIAGTLQHVLGLMAAQLNNRNIRVELSLANRLPNAQIVDSQLQQVFLNLILNAYDAMPTGGTLTISARKRKDKIEMFFQDDGSGISEEDSRNIFEPFVSTKDGGTGLGLTVSYNIMATHGGDLELVRNEKEGACFRLRLPIGDN